MFKNLFFFVIFMKVMHILAKSNADIMPVVEKAVSKLPKRVGLVSTIQHVYKLKDVAKFLNQKGLNVKIAGQVLGCDASSAANMKEEVDCFLYIGSGQFHPIEVAIETGKKVFTANPLSGDIGEISNKDIDKVMKLRRSGITRFLSSHNIGILVSIKPGQKKLKEALELKKKLKEKGKNAYVFLGETLDLSQRENFKFIESWITTACPRMIEDMKGLLYYEMAEEVI